WDLQVTQLRPLRVRRRAAARAGQQRLLVRERRRERAAGDRLQHPAGPGQALRGRAGNSWEVGDEVEVVQRPLQDVRGQVVACREHLFPGADQGGGIGQRRGPPGGGAHVVEVEG